MVWCCFDLKKLEAIDLRDISVPNMEGHWQQYEFLKDETISILKK